MRDRDGEALSGRLRGRGVPGQQPLPAADRLISALGGFLFGYDTGVISGAQLYIAQDFHLDTFAQQWVVGSLLVGAIVGAVISGYLSDRIGRKYTKVVSGSVYVVGALAGESATGSSWTPPSSAPTGRRSRSDRRSRLDYEPAR